MRANDQETQESKMAQFMYGISVDISKMVELHDYQSYQKLVHKAIWVEKQLKKGNTYTSNHSSNWTSWTKPNPTQAFNLHVIPQKPSQTHPGLRQHSSETIPLS